MVVMTTPPLTPIPHHAPTYGGDMPNTVVYRARSGLSLGSLTNYAPTSSISSDAATAWRKRGTYIVADLVRPEAVEVAHQDMWTIDESIPVPPGKDIMGGRMFALGIAWQQACLEAALREHAALTSLAPGSLFSVGVADGQAWYRVTKVGRTSTRIAWRGYGCDSYTDTVLGWGGSLPTSRAAALCRPRNGAFRSPSWMLTWDDAIAAGMVPKGWVDPAVWNQ
jgi:hypothetical protein